MSVGIVFKPSKIWAVLAIIVFMPIGMAYALLLVIYLGKKLKIRDEDLWKKVGVNVCLKFFLSMTVLPPSACLPVCL